MGSRKIRTSSLRRVCAGLAAALLIVAGLPLISAGQSPETAAPKPSMAPMRAIKPVPHPSGTGFIPPAMDLSHLTEGRAVESSSPQVLPISFDWRTSGKVTTVKDQSTCGSCYAFGFAGGFESKLLIDGAGTYDLSENHAKECNWRELNNFQHPFPGDYWGSCDGGNARMLASLYSQTGTVLESCDPYVASDVPCTAGGCPYQQTLLDWHQISGNTMPDATTLKQYLFDNGPLITSMYVDDAYDFDTYNGSWTFNYSVGGEDTNHAVLIVGWSDSLPPVPGSATPAEGWIVKNSWGTGWGDSGYFYVTYGSANLGLWTSYVAGWQPYDTNGDLWFYDDDGWWANYGWGAGEPTAWALAKYTPDRDTDVTRVEFYTTDATTDVDVYIYDSFDGTTLSGLLAQDLNNAFSEAGYHSVQLSTPLSVSNGDEIVAVVKFTTTGYGYPIAVDVTGPIDSGKTYVSQTGAAPWIEAGSEGFDVTVRLRTNSGSGTGPTVTSITPDTGPNTGVVNITNLAGTNFQAGATVKLTKAGESDIYANSVNVVSPTRITCSLDLTGAAIGAWNVVVTNPDAQSGTLTGGFAVTAEIEDYYVYLPAIMRRWPPVPYAPTLYAIDNSDGDGYYLVDWSPADLANTYELQEDDNPAFSSPTVAYSGTGTSKSFSGKGLGTYYYRVRGINGWGPGPWSNVRSTRVSVFCQGAGGDTTIIQGRPSTNFGSATDMWVGYDHCLDPEGMISRSLLGFNLTGIAPSTPVAQATLVVYHTNYCDMGQRTHTVQAFRISSNWSSGSVTWNNQPSFAEPYGWNNVTSGNWGWYGFDVTGLVRGWINGYIPNQGVMLRGPETSGTSGARLGFYTLNSTRDPVICISTSGDVSLDSYIPPVLDGAASDGAQPALSLNEMLCGGCCQSEPTAEGYSESQESLPR